MAPKCQGKIVEKASKGQEGTGENDNGGENGNGDGAPRFPTA